MDTIKTSRTFLGKSFKYKTELDENGSALWTEEIVQKFSKWLYDLSKESRDLFKVQYTVTNNANFVFNKLQEKLGAYDESLLTRAISIVFINFISTRKGSLIMKKLKSYSDSKVSRELISKENGTIKKSVIFSPRGIRDVVSYSNISKQKHCKVIQNSLYAVLLISISEDIEIKKYWENEVLSQICTIVKAA